MREPAKPLQPERNCSLKPGDVSTRPPRAPCARPAIGRKNYGEVMNPESSYLTSVKQQATVGGVKVRSLAHKGLKRLYADGSARGVPPEAVDKLRKMMAFLDDMQDPEELRLLPAWKARTLTGDRKDTWSLSVTRNRRLTFRIDAADREIYDVNLEDYH
jgi:proteic killer suppression protein